ncbi:hypothetical protein NHX12_003240 [Muraenolepis orangiensis]|uniref:Voltage-dependent calcium channel alpha-2/delta subunit conserved region domain-containing protein n=1 Tax=Muraenolepis orangiensis TaxID=630683 RepID=A0A9Q0E100_9TELE|nr:hypothetical protein NHX12_003240 [Muraenolepis orangiensis]
MPSDTDCLNIEGVCPLSCESIDLNCFLVDNNGFILLSKERAEVGRFFGEVDGSVMASLIKMGMYRKVSLTAIAMPTRPAPCSVFLLDLNLCGLWHSDYLVDAHKQKKMEALQPCDTVYPGFLYDDSIREANSLIKCGRCQKMFVAQYVPDSNLVLVVTQADCDCSRQRMLRSAGGRPSTLCPPISSQPRCSPPRSSGGGGRPGSSVRKPQRHHMDALPLNSQLADG